MSEYEGDANRLIADVDCTTEGQSLCEKVGVQGYPSIKYGDPSDLQDYNGGRDLDELKKFAEESLGPACGPANLDLCDEAKKKSLETYMKMSADRLTGKIRNALKIVEEDVPLMKKVIGYLKAQSGEAKSEL
jgi:hypothetical protein